MKISVCKLPKLDAASFFITHTIWDEEEVKISILDNDSVWVGKLTKNKALDASNALGLSEEEYWTETRLALSTNHGSAKFQYFITDNCFKWVKLVMKDAEEKLEYGSVAIETGILSLVMAKMIDFLIDTNIRLTEQEKNANEEKSRIESDKQQLVETLHRHRLEKQAMEESLYVNFLEILNAKKLKLAALQDRNHETEIEASSSKAGSSKAMPSSPQPSSSRTKPTTWRKTSQPKPVKRAKKTIAEADSPVEQNFPFCQTRRMAKTRKTKQSAIIEKPIPVTEPTVVHDECDGDIEVDEPVEQDVPFCQTRRMAKTRKTKQSAIIEKPIPVIEPTVVHDEYDGDTEVDEISDTDNKSNKGSVQFDSNMKEKKSSVECPVEPSRGGVEIQMKAGCSKQPSEMTRSELREFNTQKLLDDLGI